jgi:pimeloyl-ACP methyl ester carboxylesterase
LHNTQRDHPFISGIVKESYLLHRNLISIGVFGTVLLASCMVRPSGAFRQEATPPAPDYGDSATWASLPFTMDSADVVPNAEMEDQQNEAPVDVFYIYPTTYIGKAGQRNWNGSVYDERLNVRTDRTAVRNQATAFNGACRVFAPRYRQAHIESFYTRRKLEDARHAMQLAYGDVKKAFRYYLDRYNEGRPLIIAGHSQGTWHAAQLIRDFYDQDDGEMPQLIAAYLIGMPVKKDAFRTIGPCVSDRDIRCFCSWRTVHEKYKPRRLYPTGDEYAVINPLTWSTDTVPVDRTWHLGAVLTRFYKGLYPRLIDARIENGLLRISRPKIPGVPVMFTRNYHIADYNLFYADIRQNVRTRVEAFYSNTLVPSRK